MKTRIHKTVAVVITSLALAGAIAGCSQQESTLVNAQAVGSAADSAATATAVTSSTDQSTSASSTQTSGLPTEAYAVEYDGSDLDATWDEAGATLISMSGDTVQANGQGVQVAGSIATIVSPGTYVLSGSLSDGQIIVDSQDQGDVHLVLNGADITCSTSAPIYVMQADKTVVTLADGTENRLEDGATYQLSDPASDEPDAALYSNDDLTINGTGSLEVVAHYNHGISSMDDLRIVDGTITVEAADAALKGRDSIGISGGSLTLTAGSDGLRSTNVDDTQQGYISIEGGTLDIDAGTDGIQAETTVMITGGDISISAGDDGIHSEAVIQIEGGTLDITESYEGIESQVIHLNDGTVRISSSDDGINVVTAGTSADGGFGRGPEDMTGTENNHLYIRGGYVYVDARGDGIDVNGPIDMSGGTVLVNGPSENMNGALDYLGSFNVTGGYLVAVGSSGMAEAPSDTSAQNALMVNFDSPQAAGTIVHIETEDGQDVLTFEPTKQFQSVVVSSPELQQGVTYTVFLGGDSTGVPVDGLFTDGDYTPGSEYVAFAATGVISAYGAVGRGGMPGAPGGQSGPGVPGTRPGRG